MFLNDCGEWFVRYIPIIILILHLPYFKATLGKMSVTSYQYKSQSGAAIVKSPPFPSIKLPYFTLFVQIHSGVECSPREVMTCVGMVVGAGVLSYIYIY